MSDAPIPTLLTVRQFCEKYKWARERGLRFALLLRKTNGFEACVSYFGRRILLDEAKVFAWIEARGGGLSKPGAWVSAKSCHQPKA